MSKKYDWADTLSMIFWGTLLALCCVVVGILVILLMATIMALTALPIILVIWAVGAFL